MTLLGKLLTLLNFGISVAIMMIAITGFVNPVDFTNTPAGKDGKPPAGLFKQRAEKLQAAWLKIPPALASLSAANATLANVQKYSEAHVWFENELSSLNTGMNPVKAVKYNLAVPELDPDKAAPYRVKMEDARDTFGEPLMPLEFYTNKGTQLALDIKKQEERYIVAVEEDTKLTTRRIDIAAMKGLNTRLVDEQIKLKEAKEEASRIAPLLIDAYVGSDLSVRRRTSLEARLQELRNLEKKAER